MWKMSIGDIYHKKKGKEVSQQRIQKNNLENFVVWFGQNFMCMEQYRREYDYKARLIKTFRASLVAQWLRIRLPMQGTWVWSLAQEDATCHVATKPVHHNYWACVLEPANDNYWAHVPQLLKPTRLEPVLRSKRSHHNEKPAHRNEG